MTKQFAKEHRSKQIAGTAKALIAHHPYYNGDDTYLPPSAQDSYTTLVIDKNNSEGSPPLQVAAQVEAILIQHVMDTEPDWKERVLEQMEISQSFPNSEIPTADLMRELVFFGKSGIAPDTMVVIVDNNVIEKCSASLKEMLIRDFT